MTLKRCNLFVLAVFAVGSLIACNGPAGPAGAAGPTGAAGDAGATGPAGPTNTVFIRTTIAMPGDAGSPATVNIGTWGPFSIQGWCWSSGSGNAASAQFYIASTDSKAKLTDYWTQSNNTSFYPDGGYLPVADQASSSTASTSDLEGPYDGTFAAESSDLRTYITGLFTTGTYMGGAAGPACQFAGYVTQTP